MELEVLLFRFAIVLFLSFIFGIERQRSHKPIGFGTYIFVSVGACALSIIAVTIDAESPLPLLGAIITGIGFLGAGALIKGTDKIFGFTSASTIWLFSILGLVIGVGEYIIGAVVYTCIWFVVIYDRHLERRGIGSYQKKITIITNKIINAQEIERLLGVGASKHKLLTIDINKKEKKMTLVYQVEGAREELNMIPNKLFEKDWFESSKIE